MLTPILATPDGAEAMLQDCIDVLVERCGYDERKSLSLCQFALERGYSSPVKRKARSIGDQLADKANCPPSDRPGRDRNDITYFPRGAASLYVHPRSVLEGTLAQAWDWWSRGAVSLGDSIIQEFSNPNPTLFIFALVPLPTQAAQVTQAARSIAAGIAAFVGLNSSEVIQS